MVTSILEKVVKPMETLHGWIFSAIVFVLSFLGEGQYLLIAVVAVTLIDAFFGVWSSLKRGRFFESRRLRDSVVKLLVYSGLQLATIILDKVIATNLICMRATTALIIVCEILSILASIIIIYPKFALGKILKKYLAGEISNKLGIEKEEVDKMLDEQKNETNNKDEQA